MKKFLTFILAIFAAAVLIGLGIAQQPGTERAAAASADQPSMDIAGPEAEPAVKTEITAVDRIKTVTTVKPAGKNMALKACRCVASTTGWNNPNVHDYGIIAYYNLIDVKAPRKCSQLCSDLISGRVGMEDATAMCASNGWAGGCVRGYGYIGNRGTNNADGTAGKLRCTAPVPAVTKQKCPASWFCNGCSPSTDGGYTTDGKCKKIACGSDVIVPLPPNGTPIGTWGFTEGYAFYAWGTVHNGGAPSTVIISPAVPGAGSWEPCV